MSRIYEVWNRGQWIETIGDVYDVREWFEEQLEDALGFFVSLQESEFEGILVEHEGEEELSIYLHTDNMDDLSEEDLHKLKVEGFDFFNDEQTWERLKQFCNVFVVEVGR